ncbi:MAG: hypothetical protein DRH37_10375 [Deltaproteobacteria bacterium]|nr:MAG: hypothetical protein DRH37_10375 [Deltaproteobacteria bacterium]
MARKRPPRATPYTKEHPGFERAAERIARRLMAKEDISYEEAIKRAKAILAEGTRGASAAAKRKNPNLKRVL